MFGSSSESTRERKELISKLNQIGFNLQSDLKLLKQCVFKVNGESNLKKKKIKWGKIRGDNGKHQDENQGADPENKRRQQGAVPGN